MCLLLAKWLECAIRHLLTNCIEYAPHHLMIAVTAMPFIAAVVVAQNKTVHALFHGYDVSMLVTTLLCHLLLLIIAGRHVLGCIAYPGHPLPWAVAVWWRRASAQVSACLWLLDRCAGWNAVYINKGTNGVLVGAMIIQCAAAACVGWHHTLWCGVESRPRLFHPFIMRLVL